MTKTQQLLGAVSNDLYRAANLAWRGSIKGAQIFLTEAKKRAKELQKSEVKPYIRAIISDVLILNNNIPKDAAETLLMQSILLQNAAVHN